MAQDHKTNKILSVLLVMVVLLIVMFGYLLVTSFLQLNSLQEREGASTSELQELGVSEPVKDIEVSERALSIEEAGYNAEALKADTKLAADFFEPAFTWKKGAAYEELQEKYVQLLGENHEFIQTYLTTKRNQEAEDIKKIQASKLDEAEYIPLYANKNTVHYMAYIRYSLIEESTPSAEDEDVEFATALVKFKISGVESEREVSGIEVWS